MEKDLKELLITDLCVRMPYGVKCEYYDYFEGEYYKGTICGFERQEWIQIDETCIHIEGVKPYLFPLSSMTEEQKVIYGDLCYAIIHSLAWDMQAALNELVDWLNKNHFDYRGLIEKGLAIDCTNLNIY